MSSFQAGIVDGMHKVAAADDERQKRKKRKRALIAAGTGLGAALLAGGGLLLSRPMIRKHLMADIKAIGRGGAHAVERRKGLPASAAAQADAVAEAIRAKGLDPATARIAIAGTGGTGKSTLARGVAERLGMKVQHLDDVGKSVKGRDLGSWVKKNPIGQGTIAEQTYLLNQVNPDQFDAIIRVHKPTSQIKKQLLGRGRGAGQWEIYDYGRLDKSIRTAFDSASGAAYAPAQGVDLKFKPDGGFKVMDSLKDMAKRKGVDPAPRVSQEALVFAAAHGDKPATGGAIPYLKKKQMGGAAFAAGAAGGVGGYMGSKYEPEP